jgi:hypothetical protein
MTTERAFAAMPHLSVAPEGPVSGLPHSVPETLTTSVSEELPTINGLRLVFSSGEISEELSPQPQPIGQVETSAGTLDIMRFYDGEPGYGPLMDKVVEGRRKWYTAHNLLKEGAPNDTIRGANVEVLALTTPAEADPAVSLRKIHTEAPNNVWETPSFVKFAEVAKLSLSGLLKLKYALERNDSVVEIGALWKDGAYGADATLALYRPALHDSIKRKELWVMGVVTNQKKLLERMFGTEVVQSLGDPLTIEGEGATTKAVIHPVMIEPCRVIGTWLAESQAAKATGDVRGLDREVMMWTMLKGLDWKYLPAETSTALRRILYENSSLAA